MQVKTGRNTHETAYSTHYVQYALAITVYWGNESIAGQTKPPRKKVQPRGNFSQPTVQCQGWSLSKSII